MCPLESSSRVLRCLFVWPHLSALRLTRSVLRRRGLFALARIGWILPLAASCIWSFLESSPASLAPIPLVWQNVTHSSRTGFSIGCKNCAKFCRTICLGLIWAQHTPVKAAILKRDWREKGPCRLKAHKQSTDFQFYIWKLGLIACITQISKNISTILTDGNIEKDFVPLLYEGGGWVRREWGVYVYQKRALVQMAP